MAVIVPDIVLKAVVLHKTFYSSFSGGYQLVHLTSASFIEHVTFIVTFILVYIIVPSTRATFISFCKKLNSKLYLSIALPECFKGVAVIIQIFEQDPLLLFLLSTLVLSMQHVSFYSLTGPRLSSPQLICALAVATIAKTLTRRMFFSPKSVAFMGIIG